MRVIFISTGATGAAPASTAPGAARTQAGRARGALSRDASDASAVSSDDLTGVGDDVRRLSSAAWLALIDAAEMNAVSLAGDAPLRPAGRPNCVATGPATLSATSPTPGDIGGRDDGGHVTLWDEIAPPAPRPMPATPSRPAQSIGTPCVGERR